LFYKQKSAQCERVTPVGKSRKPSPITALGHRIARMKQKGRKMVFETKEVECKQTRNSQSEKQGMKLAVLERFRKEEEECLLLLRSRSCLLRVSYISVSLVSHHRTLSFRSLAQRKTQNASRKMRAFALPCSMHVRILRDLISSRQSSLQLHSFVMSSVGAPLILVNNS